MSFIVSTLIALAFSAYTLVNAQATTTREDLGLSQETIVQTPANTVSCFDYYSFGSVQADLSTPTVTTVSGTPITFSGTLENANAYPIVDGALYVKIFRTRSTAKDADGPAVVDQFIAVSDVNIPANGSVPVSFTWKIPSSAATGEYQLATFFSTSRKSNLLGLSFTDDVVGNMVPFFVSSERTTGVEIDKSSVMVNGEGYFFAAAPPFTSESDPVEVKAVIRNTTREQQSARVSWTIYQWDAQLRENVVQEVLGQEVKIPANGSAPISVTITEAKHPVYLAVGVLTWKDTKSIIGVRFVRPGVDRMRINFPSITSFPLVAGQANTVFSCLHNSGEADVVKGGRLELTLTDFQGQLIHNYVYEGDVTGAMMGVAQSFTPEKSYDRFMLDARLYQNGEFVDEANLVYDCSLIDPTRCSAEVPEVTATSSIFTSTESLAVIGLGIFVLIGALWIYRRISRRPYPNTTELPPM